MPADINPDYVEEFIANSQELTPDERKLLLTLFRKWCDQRPPLRTLKVVGE